MLPVVMLHLVMRLHATHLRVIRRPATHHLATHRPRLRDNALTGIFLDAMHPKCPVEWFNENERSTLTVFVLSGMSSP